MAKRLNYKVCAAEIYRLISKKALCEALALDKKCERVAMIADVVRDAVMRSSLGYFGGSYYFFNGKLYEKLSYADFYNMVYLLLQKVGMGGAEILNRKDAIMRTLTQAVHLNELEQNNALMVFGNGIYDLDNKKFYKEGKAKKEMVQFSGVEYNYVKDAVPDLWLAFLDEVLPSMELQRTLQEFLGAIFINRKQFRVETMLILHGSGANGKSVVFQTIMNLLGKDNVSNFGVHAFMGKGLETKMNVAHINGKRLNYCPDMRSFGNNRHEDFIKALISGEPMSARNMYSNQFIAYDIPLFMANCNELPDLRHFTSAMKRRLMVIPFEVTIPLVAQDHELASKLEAELPAIFNWVMEGRDRFVANGCSFTHPNKEDMYVEVVHVDIDGEDVVKFVREMGWETTIPDTESINHKWLTPRFIQLEIGKWCKAKGRAKVPNVQAVGRAMKKMGFYKKRTSLGSKWKVFKKGGWSKDRLKDKQIVLGNENILKEEA